MKRAAVVTALALAGVAGAVATAGAFGTGTAVGFLAGIDPQPVTHDGETFYRASFPIKYAGGSEILVTPIGPVDLSSKFVNGVNRVRVTLMDRCGSVEGTNGPLWLAP